MMMMMLIWCRLMNNYHTYCIITTICRSVDHIADSCYTHFNIMANNNNNKLSLININVFIILLIIIIIIHTNLYHHLHDEWKVKLPCR